MISYCKLSDQDLAELLRSGDRVAFAEIYERYKGILFVHAYKKLDNQEEAEDAIHDLFATLWFKRESLKIETNLPGYLYTAVRNKVFKVIAHKSVASDYITSIQTSVNAGNAITDHKVRENQLKAIIEKEIASLPPKMREIFELSRNEHLSHKEIAQQLELSEKTVKNQVNNALKILRVKLGIFVFIYFLIHH